MSKYVIVKVLTLGKNIKKLINLKIISNNGNNQKQKKIEIVYSLRAINIKLS